MFDFGTVLPVDVGRFENVELGQSKAPDSHAGQRDQMDAAHAAQARDGHPGVEKAFLFGRGQQSDVAP